jgi:predicted alpha/beta superfamily hydrolase
VLEEEVKPLVATNFRVDPERQGIWGYSYGGLTVLRILFRNPGAYATYIAASPSIWWEGSENLSDEGPFSRRARGGDVRVRVLITSASDEQYRGHDPARIAADKARMVDNATELAQRLGQLNPEKLVVARTVFDGEVHASVAPAALSRGIRFAFPR